MQSGVGRHREKSLKLVGWGEGVAVERDQVVEELEAAVVVKLE